MAEKFNMIVCEIVKEFCVKPKNKQTNKKKNYLISNNGMECFKLGSEMLFSNTILGAIWRTQRGETAIEKVKKMLPQIKK